MVAEKNKLQFMMCQLLLVKFANKADLNSVRLLKLELTRYSPIPEW